MKSNEVYVPRTLNLGNESNSQEEEAYEAKTLSDLIQQKTNQEDESKSNSKHNQQGEQPYVPPRLQEELGGR